MLRETYPDYSTKFFEETFSLNMVFTKLEHADKMLTLNSDCKNPKCTRDGRCSEKNHISKINSYFSDYFEKCFGKLSWDYGTTESSDEQPSQKPTKPQKPLTTQSMSILKPRKIAYDENLETKVAYDEKIERVKPEPRLRWSNIYESQSVVHSNNSVPIPVSVPTSKYKCMTYKQLESDGDSPRSESPQSYSDDERMRFQQDQIETMKLTDYISNGAAMASRSTPVDENELDDSEVSEGSESVSQRGQRVKRQRQFDRKMDNSVLMDNDIRRNTLSDHSYTLSESSSSQRLMADSSSESGKRKCIISL
jgi:hypothetical protein